MRTHIAVLVLLAVGTPAHATEIASNPELREIKTQDQAARSRSRGPIDWKVVSVQDAARRRQVDGMLSRGEVRTSEDYSNAALVYQHGEAVEEIRIAFSLATISVALDPENAPAKWLTAAAWDRIMVKLDQPQWYGTQYFRPVASEGWKLYKTDESVVSDAERKRLGVPPIDESKAHPPPNR